MGDYENKALKILHHSKQGEYDSDLAKSDYFNWKKGFIRKEVILENYAMQVCLRYEFKKLAKLLNNYINSFTGSKVGCNLSQAQAIINLSEKIESICHKHRDTVGMNGVMEEILLIIQPCVEIENGKVKTLSDLADKDKTIIRRNIAYLRKIELINDKQY